MSIKSIYYISALCMLNVGAANANPINNTKNESNKQPTELILEQGVKLANDGIIQYNDEGKEIHYIGFGFPSGVEFNGSEWTEQWSFTTPDGDTIAKSFFRMNGPRAVVNMDYY